MNHLNDRAAMLTQHQTSIWKATTHTFGIEHPTRVANFAICLNAPTTKFFCRPSNQTPNRHAITYLNNNNQIIANYLLPNNHQPI